MTNTRRHFHIIDAEGRDYGQYTTEREALAALVNLVNAFKKAGTPRFLKVVIR